MEIAVDQSNLSRALRLACRALSTRAPLPILQNVLLAADGGSLTLSAADGEIGLVTTVPADVTRSGRTAAPARLLAEYVAQLPSEPLRLALDGQGKRLRATCGRFEAGLSTANPDDFPVVPPPTSLRPCISTPTSSDGPSSESRSPPLGTTADRSWRRSCSS